MDWGNFHFVRPLWLLALTAIPLILIAVHRAHGRTSPWRRVCDAALLPHILAHRPDHNVAGRRRWLLTIVTAAFASTIVALAGPTWRRLPQPLYQDLSALVIALDLSRSMDATDVRPSRLARARFKIADLLARRHAGATAFVVYADDAYSVVPLTDDVATIASQLPVLESNLMPAQGSRPERAVRKALTLLDHANVQRGDILLVTDGITPEQSDTIAKALKGSAHRLSMLGVGTDQGAAIPKPGGGFIRDHSGQPVLLRLEAAALQSLAQRSGGIFERVSDDDRDVNALSQFITTRAESNAAKHQDLQAQQWREEGPWLLLPLLPLAALAFRRGVLAVLLVAMLPLPRPASAWEWQDLWWRPDQQGATAFAYGDAGSAAQRFEDPRWRAAARYRARDFTGALESLSGLASATDHYNRGNALARLGQYQEAISAYDQALALDPDNEDALHNRELLRKLLQPSPGNSSGNSTASPDQGAQASGGNGASDFPPQDPAGLPESDLGNNSHQDEGASRQNADAQEGGRERNLAQGSRDAEARKQKSSSPGDNQQPSPLAPSESEPVPNRETAQADEQWLRRIPDDPGGLLRRKFYYQYRQDQHGEPNETPW